MTNGIKCGVAGVGYLGKHHARIYDSLDGCELVKFWSRTTMPRRKLRRLRLPSFFELGRIGGGL